MKGGVGENVRMAMDTIRANKLRSSLTTLAIVIAITAIVVVSSVVNGLNGAVRSLPFQGEVSKREGRSLNRSPPPR